ncbi:hypothetical protein GQ53DRAFT_721087 [Thozetella sp. PMI_491]|nr:hypothetical protein GQ53DRAFT_721087 [Thozetella sp. PMI_491]
MASHGQSTPAAAPRPAAYGTTMPVGPPIPPGTFTPGTKIQVGGHRVVILKYLSEGGFAHVYLVKLPSPVNGTDQAVLKRVAVPDKESLRSMRIEVETMKRLKGHKPIVTYIDSHASELRGGGYEVFLLMEYCNGGGLIDFMNTRLQHRLTEPEILNIFTDVAEGVACMHYLKPPLLHRDLKVENVLITKVGAVKKFKVCDFGSAAQPKPAPTTVVECRLMDEDVQKHTTMQYRSPEMIDVYRKQPIDEKSDIWALGVLLYKLCYYTTPFEEQGQLAILNASYRFPSYPAFSDRLKKLISSMLRENQKQRPNIYQVLREACAMQGREPPIKDIYSGRSQSEPRGNERLPATDEKVQSTPVVGAVFSPQSSQQQKVIPEVERMRRGRVPASQPAPQKAKPSTSPSKVTDGDPFAALDSKTSTKGRDELSSRFPTLDQFSLLHDSGAKFDFETATTSPPIAQQPAKDLSQRVSERLADDAFQTKPSPAPSQRVSSDLSRPAAFSSVPVPEQKVASPPLKSSSAPPKPTEMSRASAIISNTPELQAISVQASQPLYQPAPKKAAMISTGTMTTTPPPERSASTQQYQIYRFPQNDTPRSSSVPRPQDSGPSGGPRTETPASSNAGAIPRVPSFPSRHQPAPTYHASSSRPSLETSRPSQDLLDAAARQPALSSRPRPVSTHLESNLEYLREREAVSKPSKSPALPSPRFTEKDLPPPPPEDDDTAIESNVDFLRSMEDADPRKKDKGLKHGKRTSLTSLGAGTKNIFAGKFGDAFKRFEGSTGGPTPRTPSPLKDLERRDLTPIAGSEATDGRSDDGQLQDLDSMTPEMRREQEARMLAQEEARVAAAQAEYRQRVGQRGQGGGPTPLPKSIGGVSRAVSIQNKVQNLLEESTRSKSNVPRTAEGYGHFADAATTASRPIPREGRPPIPRKPVGGPPPGVARVTTGGAGRPMAPPKPIHLNQNMTSNSTASLPTGGRAGSPPKPSVPSGTINVAKLRSNDAGMERLVAVNLPGQPVLDNMTPAEKDDYIRDFQKRFPSLTSIEMVERDLAAEAGERSGR